MAGKKSAERREQIKNELRKHKMPDVEHVQEHVNLPIVGIAGIFAVLFGIYICTRPKPTPEVPAPPAAAECQKCQHRLKKLCICIKLMIYSIYNNVY